MRLIVISLVLLAMAATVPKFPPRLAPIAGPATVTIPAKVYGFRRSGTIRADREQVPAPLETLTASAPLVIMRDLVTRADYAHCVADKVCAPSLTGTTANLPQTNVSYDDATAYARWLSARTGGNWRLPDEAEWARAAADRYPDVAELLIDDRDDPARAWLRDYALRTAATGTIDAILHPVGSFGTNTNGLTDIAGNVWEWTSTCQETLELGRDGTFIEAAPPYCGVRLVAGPHTAFVIDFVRDASAGGCAAGVPPAHLGFRLVRDPV